MSQMKNKTNEIYFIIFIHFLQKKKCLQTKPENDKINIVHENLNHRVVILFY